MAVVLVGAQGSLEVVWRGKAVPVSRDSGAHSMKYIGLWLILVSHLGDHCLKAVHHLLLSY